MISGAVLLGLSVALLAAAALLVARAQAQIERELDQIDHATRERPPHGTR